MLLGIVESNPLFQVLLGQGKLAKDEQGLPQYMVGMHKEYRVVGVLGPAQALLCQLTGRLELRPPYKIKS